MPLHSPPLPIAINRAVKVMQQSNRVKVGGRWLSEDDELDDGREEGNDGVVSGDEGNDGAQGREADDDGKTLGMRRRR